ncbi:MAG: FecR domain-containing protein [Alphaproteobacteria bacterium]|nr:FecR domain-containing protein [Alphaproteobacteria bacterium]
MATLSELLAAARAASEASPEEVARLRVALLTELDADPELAARLHGLGAAEPDAVQRVRARLGRSLARRRQRAAVGAMVAVAAVALLSLLLRPAPPVLLDAAHPGTLRTLPGVVIHHAGDGRVAGTEAAPRVAWEQGDLDVEVDPARGIDLVVATPDARVEVVGTVFQVRCDALGTHVGVTRGKVAVACGDGPARSLVPDEQPITCLPHDPGRLLGRARTLRAQGAPVDEVLASLDAALAVSSPLDLASELVSTRLAVLVEAGRTGEARATARRYLEDFPEGTRRAEVEAFLRRR